MHGEFLDEFDLDLGHECVVVVRAGGKTVLARSPRGVREAGHVHGVSSEALHVDFVVVQDVSIEAVVVPDLVDAWVFEVVFEDVQDSQALSRVVQEKLRTRTEVHLGADEGRGTQDCALAHWRLLFYVHVGGLGVPGMDAVLVLVEGIYHGYRLVFRSDYTHRGKLRRCCEEP